MVPLNDFESVGSAAAKRLDDALYPEGKLRPVVRKEIEIVGKAVIQVTTRSSRATGQVETSVKIANQAEDLILKRIEDCGVGIPFHPRRRSGPLPSHQ